MTSHHGRSHRFPRGRRTGAATLSALLILILAVAAGYLVVCITLRRPSVGIDIDRLRSFVSETSWSDPTVLIAGIVIGVLGLAMITIATFPARRPLVELKNPDSHFAAGIPERSLRRTVRSAAVGIDGISNADVSLGHRRIRLNVTTGLRHIDSLPEATERAVSGRLRALDLSHPRSVGVRLSRKEL